MASDKKKKLVGDRLRKRIQAASEGLVYISETDSTIRPLFIRKEDAASLKDALLLLAAQIDECAADAFFTRLTSDHDWHRERDKENVRRFRILKDLLTENLADLRQYRLGKVRITIYVIGYDKDGNVAGVSTQAVET